MIKVSLTFWLNVNQHSNTVIQLEPRITRPTPQGYIQMAPQIFVPDVPAGGLHMASDNSPSDDDIRIPVMDEN